MSPTHTWPAPAGASASTSSGPSAQKVMPTVSPVAMSTVKTRPVSPESLIVWARSPSRTSPLDSTISESWKRKTSRAVAVGAGGGEPDDEGREDGEGAEGAQEPHQPRARPTRSASLGVTPHVATRSS